MMRFIILHCSATRVDRRYTFEQCRADHISHRGWRDIGYHYYVELDGSVHIGRPEGLQGAHCRGHNHRSIGVCYEGGLSRYGNPMDTRTEAQKAALWLLLQDLHRRHPHAMIVGHRDLSPDRNGDGRITPDEYVKLCPCFDARREYEELQPPDWEIAAMVTN